MILAFILLVGVGVFLYQNRQTVVERAEQEPAARPSLLDPPPASRSCPECPEFLIDIRNLRSRPVEIYWVDFSGQEQLYGRCEPGTIFSQPTSATDVWTIREGDKRLQNIIHPQSRRIYDVE